MLMHNLLPCPFCGGAVSIAEKAYGKERIMFITRGIGSTKKNCKCRVFMESELSGKVRQLQAERDAAVKDIEFDGACEVCKYIDADACEAPCNHCFHINKGRDSRFEWRGVQKEG